MKNSIAKLAFACALLVVSGMAYAQMVTIGEHVSEELDTMHPYVRGTSEQHELIRTDIIHYPKATYIAVHFAHFELANGDYVIVRSPDDKYTRTYTGQGRHNLGVHPEGFFATHVKGDMAIVELYSKRGEDVAYGYTIDFYGRGYNDTEIAEFWAAGLGEVMNLPQPQDQHDSICTADDTEEVKCYQMSEPLAYDKARAVARLTLNGAAHCTGWLIGDSGHLMTNEHCIGSQSQLNNIDFEFMAEGPDCATNCASSLACGGIIEASGGTLVQVDAPLDFALVIPDTSTGTGTDLPSTYGFMQLRPTGAVLDERLYIAQHPAGWGKRLAMESSYPGDGGFARVNSISEQGCSGPEPDVGYWADTQGGSSGSPVLGYSDNLVIALHHCRGSASCTTGGAGDDPNRGVPVGAIITSLGANIPPNAVCTPPDVPANVMVAVGGDNQLDLSWTASAGASGYDIYRAIGDCNASFELIASDVTGTSFSDTNVSGNVDYSYKLVSKGDCQSVFSACVTETATGICTRAPDFLGVTDVVNQQGMQCGIEITWGAANVYCSPGVVYNVYRSETPNFTPGPANLLASCVMGTSYVDNTAKSGVTYYFIVRAEDQSGNGSGPCANGVEDDNTVEISGFASGPDELFFEDDVEGGGANFSAVSGPGDPGGTAPWSIVTTGASSPTHSWFVSDEPSQKDQVLETANAIALPDSPGLRLSFQHMVDTESNWDGGVLEYSLDGTTWVDILAGTGGVPANADRFLDGGYPGNLNTSAANPLTGRAAWNGNLGPFSEVLVDLDDFRNMNLYLRWRMGCDGSVGAPGWWIDDIRVFYGTECGDSLPPMTLDMWHNDPMFLNGYDTNGNGAVDVIDILTHWQVPAR